MEEAEAFPEEETDAPSSTEEECINDASGDEEKTPRVRVPLRRRVRLVFPTVVVVSSPLDAILALLFSPRRLHAAKAADGLRVKSRRKKPQGRVNEEDDFDRGERGDKSGEKEEEKSVSS